MGTAQLNGVDIYYEIHGDGPPLVLIAGLASDSQSWLPVIEPLSRWFTVIVYDNRGVGRTTPADAEIEISLLADDGAALIDRLGHSKVHLLGHSMGGLVAQDVAARYPDRIDRLVLVGTSLSVHADLRALLHDLACFLDASTDVAAWYRELFRWLFTKRFLRDEAAVAEAARLAMEYPYPQSAEQFRRQVEAVARFPGGDPESIGARTLVITGAEDLLVPPELGAALAARLAHAEHLVMQGVAHSIHMEAPDAFVDAVVQFLQGR